MTTDQLSLPGDEILNQAAICKLMSVSRAVVNGFFNRGELPTVDRLGAHKSRRTFKSAVLQLMQKTGMAVPDDGVLPLPATESCGDCPLRRRTQVAHDREREENRRLREDLARAHAALYGALGRQDPPSDGH